MRTAIAALRKLGAGRIVVAAPTAPSRSLEAMRKLADEIVAQTSAAAGRSPSRTRTRNGATCPTTKSKRCSSDDPVIAIHGGAGVCAPTSPVRAIVPC